MKKTLISTILATALISTMIATVANASVTEDNILINLNSSVETNIEEIDYASMISSIQLPVLVENLKTYMEENPNLTDEEINNYFKNLIKYYIKKYDYILIDIGKDSDEFVKEKIEKIATKIYGAEGVEYSDEAEKIIQDLEKNGYGNMPVCIAKTQYSFSDDAKNLLCLEPFKIHVKNVILKTGAGFIVILTGNIFTMPGLPKVPAAEKIDIDENGNIVGIF